MDLWRETVYRFSLKSWFLLLASFLFMALSSQLNAQVQVNTQPGNDNCAEGCGNNLIYCRCNSGSYNDCCWMYILGTSWNGTQIVTYPCECGIPGTPVYATYFVTTGSCRRSTPYCNTQAGCTPCEFPSEVRIVNLWSPCPDACTQIGSPQGSVVTCLKCVP
jgi:hypothetical protein